MTEIFSIIDDTVNESELDVITSVVESYQKFIRIMDESDYNESIIQETVLFTEATDTSTDKKSITTSIKESFKKLFNAIRDGFVKIANKVKKVYATKKERFITVVNCLRLLDVLKNTTVTPVTEGYCDVVFGGIYQEFNDIEFDDEIVQEGISDSIRMHIADRRIAKEIKLQDKPVIDALVTFYNSEIRHNVISKKDLTFLVRALAMTNSRDKMNAIKNALDQLNNSTAMTQFSEETIRNYKLATTLGDELISRKAQEIERQMKDKMGAEEAKRRLDLIEKFSDTLGGAIDSIQGQNNLKKTNVANMLYGGENIAEKLKNKATAFNDLCDFAWKTLTNLPNTCRNLEQIGAKLYEKHIDFDDAVFDDEQERKQLNMKADKLAQGFLYCANGLKEETYGYKDDWFNKDVFNMFNQGFKAVPGSVAKWIIGGPVSFCMKVLGYLMTGAVTFISAYSATNDAKSAAIGAGAVMAGKFVDGITVKNIAKVVMSTAAQAKFAKKMTPDVQKVSKRQQAQQQQSP